jgi:hypothetical protein
MVSAASDLQRHIERRHEPDAQPDVVLLHGLKARKRVGHLVDADREGRKPVVASLIGDGRHLSDLQSRTGGRDSGTGNVQAAVITNPADYAGSRRLAKG